MTQNLPERFALIRNSMGVSQREMSNILSISPGGWRVIEAGTSVPGGQTIARLVELGFNANWILTGQGDMRLAEDSILESPQTPELAFETPSNPLKSIPDKGSIAVPDELYARVFEAVTKTYDELKIRISPRVLGELISAKSKEIAAAGGSPEEWPAVVNFVAAQIRQELLKPASDPERSKHTA